MPPIKTEFRFDFGGERGSAFRVQCVRVPSAQPRLLDASARGLAGAHAPGGPYAKTPPRALQTATLVLKSALELEKVVLALREAEKAVMVERATRLAAKRREEQVFRALREEGPFGMLLRHQLLYGGEGERISLILPPPEPVVYECARHRARGDDRDILDVEARFVFPEFFVPPSFSSSYRPSPFPRP